MKMSWLYSLGDFFSTFARKSITDNLQTTIFMRYCYYFVQLLLFVIGHCGRLGCWAPWRWGRGCGRYSPGGWRTTSALRRWNPAELLPPGTFITTTYYFQYCCSGSGIRDLVPFWPLVSGIRDEQPGSYFLELRKHFSGLKYFNSLMRIRDPEWKKVGFRDPV